MICRAATDDDMGFIAETFLRSIRSASTQVEGLENAKVVRLLTNLLAAGWTATVAEDAQLILGWAVHGERNRLAWFYVRDMFRRQGVGRYLLKTAGIDTGDAVTSPFLPNRSRFRGWHIIQRPFEALP